MFRILIRGLSLLFANLVGIFSAHILCRVSGVGYQLGIQLPLAAVISVFLYLVWDFILQLFRIRRLYLQTRSEIFFAWLCALLWNPVVFIPLHFYTQQYLTSAANIAALAAFQIPVNAVAGFLAWKVLRHHLFSNGAEHGLSKRINCERERNIEVTGSCEQ